MPQVVHSTFQGLELHEDKRIKVPVRAASTANVSLAAPGATIDGVTLVASDRVLLKNQTTLSQNGIYVWTGAATALTRATDANTAALLFFGFLVYVREGTANGGTLWMFTQSAAVTLETTALTFSAVGATNLSGEMTAADFKVTGLTGATAGMRIVGATASGAPTTGTFAVGDVVEDQAAGGFWACTVAGTPGTWIRTGFANPMTAVGDLIVGGTAGAATRLAPGAATNVLTSNGVGVPPTWQTATGGGGGGTGLASNGMVPIQTVVLGAVQASVILSVPPGYRNLRVVVSAASNNASNDVTLQMTFNGDVTASHYVTGRLFNFSGGAAPGGAVDTTNAFINVGSIAGASSAAGSAGSAVIEIPNYTSAFNKTAEFRSGEMFSTASIAQNVGSGLWISTAAITSITFAPSAGSFITNSFFQIWGELDSAPTLPASQSSLIQEVVLGTAAATISLANIPQTYRDLRLVMQGAGDTAATSISVNAQLNSDTAANYDWSEFEYNGGATGVAGGLAATSARVAILPAATAPASTAGQAEISMPNYATTTFNKTLASRSTYKTGTATINNLLGDVFSGWWRNTAAITSIVLAPSAGNFVAGTVVRLYGEPATSLPKIAEVVLSASQTTITFSSIPQTYRNLRLTWQARGDTVAVNTQLRVQINGDTTASYDAAGHFASATPSTGGAGAGSGAAQTAGTIADISAASAPAGASGTGVATLPNYPSTTFRKSISSYLGFKQADTAAGTLVEGWFTEWRNTAAVTSIVLFPTAGNFLTGSVFTLYGEP